MDGPLPKGVTPDLRVNGRSVIGTKSSRNGDINAEAIKPMPMQLESESKAEYIEPLSGSVLKAVVVDGHDTGCCGTVPDARETISSMYR